MYDEVATLTRELQEESKKLLESNGFADELVKSPDSPLEQTKSKRTRDAKSSSSFEFFEPLCLGSKKEEHEHIDIAGERTAPQEPDHIQDDIDNQDSVTDTDEVTSESTKQSSHSYVNVDDKVLDKIRTQDMDNIQTSTDTLYDDVTLIGTSVVHVVEEVPVTTLTTFEDKLKTRQSLGNSMASESSTASYIDIEEEILSKGFADHRPLARENVMEEVVIKSTGDDYDLLANTSTTQEDEYDLLANVTSTSEQIASDDDAAIEKSSSSSCKDSGDDSDTIYANIADEPPELPIRETNVDDDVYLRETLLRREKRTASSYHLKFGTDPDAPEVYGRPDRTVSGNSYLSLLEDFQTMDHDREHASYYISDDTLAGTFDFSVGKFLLVIKV